jgi:hypothetical protein
MEKKRLKSSIKRPRLTPEQWAALRERYESGESFKKLEIGAGVAEYTIRERARKEGWEVSRVERAQQVQERTRERLDGLAPAPGPEAAADPMAVAVEAKVRVVLAHRTLIARIRGVVNDLLELAEYQSAELRARVEREPAEDRGTKALTQLVETRALGENLRTLTNTTSQLVTMEREAFGIQAAEGPREETYEERLKRLLEQSKAK